MPSSVLRWCVFVLTVMGISMAKGATGGYPDKPVTIVVPFAAGSPTDITARALAEELRTFLKTSVVVDNKTGAGQVVASTYVYRAPPDGYTLLLANLPNAIAPSVAAKLPYKDFTDFSPVAEVMSISLLLAASPTSGITSVKDLVSNLRSNLGALTYGSGGIGSVLHLMSERFNKDMGSTALHIPFKSGQQVLLELAANRLTYSFLAMNAMEFVEQGKIKALGITAAQRNRQYPDLPTLSEQGINNFNANVGFLLLAPRGTPDDILDALNSAVQRVVASKVFAAKIQGIGGVSIAPPSSVKATGESISRQEREWQQLIKSANIQLE